MNTLITDIRDLRGKEVRIFGQPVTLSNKVNEFEIDIIEVMNKLSEFQVDLITEEYDEENDEYNEIYCDSVDEYMDYMESLGYIDTTNYKANNSYNWNSPVSNHFNYNIYNHIDGGILVEFKVHRFGDVRSNYTDTVLLQFNNEYEFFDCITECNKNVTIEVNDQEYYIYINALNDAKEVYCDGGYIGETYEDDYESIVEYLLEKVA